MAYNSVPGSGFLCKRKYPNDPRKEVFEAAESGDAVLLSEVLQQMEANEKTSALETDYISEYSIKATLPGLLMVAALNGHLDCVKVLVVEHGAINVDLEKKMNETPLMLASERGHLDVVTFLVEHGANVNHQHELGFTPLVYASEFGHLDVVTFLVEHGSDVNPQQTLTHTPLMAASANGYVDVVAFLVEHGANVNLQDQNGVTSLMSACIYNHRDVVTFLVQQGANVDLQDKEGNTALFFIWRFHYSDDYCCDVLSCLITNGADVNACAHDNCTPLMKASRNGHINAVTFLVENGANMDFQDKNGNTALHYAITSGNAEAGGYCIVEKLLTLGASQLYNNEQLTPLLEASNKCQSLTVEHLIKRTEYTKEQRIDALELLGASLATHATPDTTRAFHYIKCGMTERFQDPSQPLFKQPMEPVEAYQNRKESQTLEELAQIEGDRNAIMMEGLVIRERILGTDNTTLLEPIRHVAVLDLNFDFAICIGLYRHAIKIAQHCNQSISEDIRSIIIGLDLRNVFLSQKDLVLVLELLEEIVLGYKKQEKARQHESLEFKLIYEPHVVLDLSIQLVQIIAKFKHFKEGKTSPVSVLLQKLYSLNLRDDHGNTLLHKAVEHRTSGSQQFPCIDTVKVLLNSGINVNAISKNGDTPLHKAVTYKPSSNKIHHLTSILEALLDGGAHHDFLNNAGETAMDLAETYEAYMILSQKRKLELKCISARAVKKFGLPYLGEVPKILEKYISMH